MSRSFGFNPAQGFYLDRSGNLAIVTDLERLKQKIQQRLQFFAGEWFVDTTVGLDYIQEVFDKGVNPGLAVSLINGDISQEPDVTNIREVNVEYDAEENKLTYRAIIDTVYGSFNVSVN